MRKHWPNYVVQCMLGLTNAFMLIFDITPSSRPEHLQHRNTYLNKFRLRLNKFIFTGQNKQTKKVNIYVNKHKISTAY